MWRYIDGASQPKKRKQSEQEKKEYNKEYEKKRSRQFNASWTKDRPWLKDTDHGMICDYCVQYEKDGRQRSSLFITGNTSYKLETVKIHEQSQSHKQCRAICEAKSKPVSSSVAASTLRKLNDENFKKMYSLFKIGHSIAIHNRPFSDFIWMTDLYSDISKDCYVGETYMNVESAKTFVSYIAKAELNKVSSRIKLNKFICIIGDGSTDASVKEQEMWYVRSCRDGVVSTDFIGIDSCEKASAENIVHGIQNIVKGLDIEWKEFCGKMVAIACDGASVMTGRKGGVGALLRQEQPALITIHCIAHRLELAIKDAAKTVKLYDKTVNVLAMGLYYFYHNSSLNRAMLTRSSKALRSDSDKGLLLPTRVGGTRWIGHTYMALDHLIVSYKYIVGHLGQLTEPAEKVSVDSKAKAKAFLKLLSSKSVVYFIYFLMDVLTPLKKLSLGVQDRASALSQQHSTIEAVVEVLHERKTSDGPHLRKAKETESQLQLKGDDREFNAARTVLIDNMESALEKRFAEFSTVGVIKATKIGDLKSWPKNWEILKDFGNEDVIKLTNHYSSVLKEAGVETDDIESEWTMLKKDISENEIKFETWKDVCDVYSGCYPNILALMDLISTFSPSSAEAERGFSQMKLLKTKIRSNLSQGSLNDLLLTKMHAPVTKKYDPTDAIHLWNNDGARTRRVNLRDKHKYPTEYTVRLEPDEVSVEPEKNQQPQSDKETQPVTEKSVQPLEAPMEIEKLQSDNQPQPFVKKALDSPVSIIECVSVECQTESNGIDMGTQTEMHTDNFHHELANLAHTIDRNLGKYYSSDESDGSEVDSDLEEDIVFTKLADYNRLE